MSSRGPLTSTGNRSSSPELPTLTPHLEYRLIGDGQVLLVSESFNTLLKGQLYADLIPLLNGHRTQDEVVRELKDTHSEIDVASAMRALADKDYIVSGEFGMSRGRAAFWSSLCVAPHLAEKRLHAAAVAVHGDNEGRLARSLSCLGIATGSDEPDLSVFVCDDYLDREHVNINLRSLDSGAPWALVRPKGMQPLFGPVFRPAQKSACWDCLTHRLMNNNDVHSFLRNHCGEAEAYQPNVAEPLMLEAVFDIVAMEIAKWIVLGELAPLHNHAITFDIAGMKSAYHPVMRRSQCTSCGDAELRRPDREPAPMTLQSNQQSHHTSGGLRTAAPSETLDRYRHLISPVSGIVTWVKRTAPDTDQWLHVHWAGSNSALKIKNLSSLRRSLRSKSAGKGTTAEQSEVSALCEAIERYSGACHGDEIRCRRRLSDFLAEDADRAIHPNDVQLFSDHQLSHAEEINARQHPYNVIPPRFDPDRELDWTPVWSFTENRHRYLPTAMLYGMTPQQRESSGLWSDSNGCAAGNTIEEAILQGFLELAERDSFAIWWYNRLRRPGVDLESFNDDYLARAADYYRSCGREMWVLDITADLGIATFVALSRRIDSETEDIIYGAGAHIDPHIAVLRAVCELNQSLILVPKPGPNSAGYMVDDPMCLWWWQQCKLENQAHLAACGQTPPRQLADYEFSQTDDLRDSVQWCRAQVEAKGMEFLALDQTRPDVGMPVVRVIVPGLRHFWERFAPGRLYEVPVSMGWRESPIEETNLNSVPVIA